MITLVTSTVMWRRGSIVVRTRRFIQVFAIADLTLAAQLGEAGCVSQLQPDSSKATK